LQSLCWTPDSKALVVSAAEAARKPHRLMLVPLDGREPRPLTHPDANAYGDGHPAISGDGRNLAFLRENGGGPLALVVPLSGAWELQGEPRRMSRAWRGSPAIVSCCFPGARSLLLPSIDFPWIRRSKPGRSLELALAPTQPFPGAEIAWPIRPAPRTPISGPWI